MSGGNALGEMFGGKVIAIIILKGRCVIVSQRLPVRFRLRLPAALAK